MPTAAAPPAMAMPMYPSARGSASSLEGKCEQRTPLYSGLDEAVKGLCLQVGWLPFQ